MSEETDALPPSPYMTVDEAKAYLRCGHALIYKLMPHFEARKAGDKTLIKRASIDAYLEAHPFKRDQGHHMTKASRELRKAKNAIRTA